MRLIDADAFIADTRMIGLDTAEKVLFALSHQPTIEPIEIIHCKDCEHCHLNVTVARMDNGYESILNICEQNKWFVPEDGHCHRAKRKE